LVAGVLCAAGCDGGESPLASLRGEAVPGPGPTGAPAPEPLPRAAGGRAPAAEPRPAAAAAPPAAPGPEGAGGYWRYTEANGSLRFVESLAEVPASARASAQRVAAAAPRPAPAPSPRRAGSPPPGRARAAPPEAPARRGEAASVVVYTTSWCGWCRRTLAWLDARGVAYENRDIERDPRWAAELQRRTGSQAIPVVDVDGELVRGFDPATLERLL
jgi:glutaredoxin